MVARELDRGVVERHGLRFTDRARTVAELLRGSALIPQLWLLDQALRGDVPRDAITAHLPAGGYGSATRARRLLSLGDARSESPLESAVAMALAAGGVPAPERQLVVRDARGAFLARVDFAWPDHHVLLEADGLAHHTAPKPSRATGPGRTGSWAPAGGHCVRPGQRRSSIPRISSTRSRPRWANTHRRFQQPTGSPAAATSQCGRRALSRP